MTQLRSQLEARGVAGWITGDIDEVHNRVTIGVESEEVAQRVTEFRSALRISPSAILVRTEKRPTPPAYLSSRLDTTKAGTEPVNDFETPSELNLLNNVL